MRSESGLLLQFEVSVQRQVVNGHSVLAATKRKLDSTELSKKLCDKEDLNNQFKQI